MLKRGVDLPVILINEHGTHVLKKHPEPVDLEKIRPRTLIKMI